MEQEFLLGHAPMAEKAAMMLNPIRLAYLGDAVYDLFVRTSLVFGGEKANSMHRDAVRRVNAAAQAKGLSRLLPLLTETEADVARRGRNAHGRHGAPRRADPADYAQATGLEALFGFLYLTGQVERMRALFSAMQEKSEEA